MSLTKFNKYRVFHILSDNIINNISLFLGLSEIQHVMRVTWSFRKIWRYRYWFLREKEFKIMNPIPGSLKYRFDLMWNQMIKNYKKSGLGPDRAAYIPTDGWDIHRYFLVWLKHDEKHGENRLIYDVMKHIPYVKVNNMIETLIESRHYVWLSYVLEHHPKYKSDPKYRDYAIYYVNELYMDLYVYMTIHNMRDVVGIARYLVAFNPEYGMRETVFLYIQYRSTYEDWVRYLPELINYLATDDQVMDPVPLAVNHTRTTREKYMFTISKLTEQKKWLRWVESYSMLLSS